MAYKNTVLSTTGHLQLVKSVKEKGSTKYLIVLKNGWRYKRLNEVYALIETSKNKYVSMGIHRAWKFNTRREAEEVIAVAALSGLT